MATLTDNTPQKNGGYASQVIDHLGLVAGMLDELGIAELIDVLIPQDKSKRIVSIGQAVKAMVLNGLGFVTRALYLSPFFFQNKPVGQLVGPGIEAKHLNDDTLGRALDDIYDYGPTKLYSALATQAVQRLGLHCRFGHLDTTTFHTDGQGNEDESDPNIIHVTRGFSRDHRPDLNQVALQLICEQQAGIPLAMEALSGNTSDKKSFREAVDTHIRNLKSDMELEYVVADSALYTAETLRKMNDIYWITRVPETLSLSREMIHAAAGELMQDLDKEAFCTICTCYGDVRQRCIVIYSPKARKRALSSAHRACSKRSKAESKNFHALCKKDFACEADARKEFARLEKTLTMTMVTEVQVDAFPRFKTKGRPSQNRQPDYFVYRVSGALASRLDERDRKIERGSCYILASNQLDDAALSEQEIIDTYKRQQKVEHGFRFLKDPMFAASTLFLKSPQRLMALMMVMTLSLLIYAALEYRIRTALAEHHATFPNQKGRPITNPTARWVFQYFRGIHLLIKENISRLVLNLNEHHQALLILLGENYEKQYADSG